MHNQEGEYYIVITTVSSVSGRGTSVHTLAIGFKTKEAADLAASKVPQRGYELETKVTKLY